MMWFACALDKACIIFRSSQSSPKMLVFLMSSYSLTLNSIRSWLGQLLGTAQSSSFTLQNLYLDRCKIILRRLVFFLVLVLGTRIKAPKQNINSYETFSQFWIFGTYLSLASSLIFRFLTRNSSAWLAGLAVITIWRMGNGVRWASSLRKRQLRSASPSPLVKSNCGRLAVNLQWKDNISQNT